MEGTNQRQVALSYALLMYMVGIALLITLIPFQFYIPHELSNIWVMYLNNSITNFMLFIPLGFLFQLSRRNHNGTLCVKSLGFGLLVSVVIITRRWGMYSKKCKLDDMEQAEYHNKL